MAPVADIEARGVVDIDADRIEQIAAVAADTAGDALPGTPPQKTDGVVLVWAVLTWSFSVRFQ